MNREKLNQRKATWDRNNTVMVSVKLQNSTDSDILEYLNKRTVEGASRQGIIKAAIREYIANHPET